MRLLSRRIERLTLGARSIEGGDFSSRIHPGSDDELGELARSFNAMAARLQASFLQLEENNARLDAVVNNLSEGVLAVDLEGDVLFANDSVKGMLNLKEDAAPGKVPDAFEEYDLPGAVASCVR